MESLWLWLVLVGAVSPIWLYYTVKLVVVAFYNARRQSQRREKDGEESA